MPLDKYIQQIQKTKLWAHRRNSTAQKQLMGRLKHLEQDYESNCRQYLRNKIRIQSELRDLEALPSCDDKDEVARKTERVNGRNGMPLISSNMSPRNRATSERNEQSNGSYRNSVTGTPATVSSHTPTSFSTSTPTSFSTRTPSRNTSSKLSVARCISVVSAVDATDGHVEVNDQNISTASADSSSASFRDSVPRGTWSGSTKSSPRMARFSSLRSETGKPKTSDISMDSITRPNLMSKSTESLCKYIETRSAPHDCNYFPCKVPETYHTLGYRREDLCTWINDSLRSRSEVTYSPCPVDEPVHQRILTNGKSVYFETCSNSRDTLCNSEQAPTLRSTVYPKWCKNKSLKVFKFQEPEGPLFTAKPRDPILDQIRSGATKPLDEPRCTTRTTVRAKIRGLKQLVTEMRARNERTRPVDWAINYGAKMPTRLLLNPVFPVGSG
ncbi:unnamed protein product [Lymnaea stagnalis]|uniref:Uncharacterized protein n=1 Tax=Lymnaea stagnalis TaxID=6523 RepID=A0AAV2GYZ2_LYMST